MMKTPLAVAFAAGYVLGSRAGRERYEEIKTGAQKFANNPRVRSAKDKAQDTVTTQAAAAAEVAKEKVGDAASAASDKVGRDTSISVVP